MGEDSVHKPQHLKREDSPSGVEQRFFCLPAFITNALLLGHAGFYFQHLRLSVSLMTSEHALIDRCGLANQRLRANTHP